jgi:ABC-type uncharacterized transport system fused permease/ATPase subunit
MGFLMQISGQFAKIAVGVNFKNVLQAFVWLMIVFFFFCRMLALFANPVLQQLS